MALGITNRGSGTHNVSATSFTLSPGTDFSAQGSWGVLCIAADNTSTGGATNDFTTVTDSLGNTWTKRQSPVFDNGAASAGVQGAIYTTPQNAGKLVTGTVITVNFGSSPTAKTWTLTEVVQNGSEVISFRAGGNKSAGATNTVLALGNSATVFVGEVIVACFYLESGITQSVSTPDGDTSNGTWTTNQYAEIGTTTSGSGIVSQGKIQTTTASVQSYDVTVGVSSDYHGSYVILHSIANTAVTPGTASVVITPFTATVAATNNKTATPGTASLTTTRFAPTVAVSTNATVVPGTASLTVTPFAPTVAATANVGIVPGTATLEITEFVPAVAVTANAFVAPGTASISISTYVPSVVADTLIVPGTLALNLTAHVPVMETTGGGVTVIPGTASLAITTYAMVVEAAANAFVVPGTASLVFTCHVPTIDVGGDRIVTPGAVALLVTCHVPMVLWAIRRRTRDRIPRTVRRSRYSFL